jgi:hypothetical protein
MESNLLSSSSSSTDQLDLVGRESLVEERGQLSLSLTVTGGAPCVARLGRRQPGRVRIALRSEPEFADFRFSPDRAGLHGEASRAIAVRGGVPRRIHLGRGE